MTERIEVTDDESNQGPWPDRATAFAFLRFLSLREPGLPPAYERLDQGALARWLCAEDLAALAQWRTRDLLPGLAARLKATAFHATAETSVILAILDELETAAPPSLRLVALKGAALALCAYPDPALRSMADLDLWPPGDDFEIAQALLVEMGFASVDKADRPRALQELSQGEAAFRHGKWVQGIVELHRRPLKGWWYSRTAAIDFAGIAARCRPLAEGRQLQRMADEDMALHVAAHLAVSNQFGEHVWRGFVDLALLQHVDWAVVAGRARAWRVATAVWLVLSLFGEALGAEAQAAGERLRPGRLRRWLLSRFVSVGSLLAGHDPRRGRGRFALLLLLVDRKRDALRLVGRTLWPEHGWLEARYGQRVSHAHHFWQVVRHGRV